MKRLATILFIGTLALAAQDLGPKIADIRAPQGGVTLQRGGEFLDVRAVGRRVVNGDLYDSDHLATTEDARCDVIFADDSRVTLEAGTQISIEQRRLREPSDAGKTVARRISILAGHVTSDIIPSADVQTDFVTPAGTAAIRGTFVDISVQGPAANVGIDYGHGAFAQGPHVLWQMPPGAHVAAEFDPATGRFTIENVGPDPLVGQVGELQVQVSPGGGCELQPGGDAIQVVPQEGVSVLNEETGLWEAVEEPQTAPVGDEPLYEEPATTDEPAAGDDASGDPSLENDPFAESGAGSDAATSIANALGTSAGGTSLLDDFNRGDGPIIGNNWTELESEGNWDIVAGRAVWTCTSLGGGENWIARTTGNLATFEFSALIRISSSNLTPFITANGDMNSATFPSGSGLRVQYSPVTHQLEVITPGGSNFVALPGSAFINMDFTLASTFDGTTFCGHLDIGSASHLVCIASSNTPGTDLIIGQITTVPSIGDQQEVDDVHQP